MSKLDTLDPEFRKKVDTLLLELLKQTGYQWGVAQTRRTIKYQDQLYNQPHDGIDNDKDGKIDEADEKVTNAKGGQSPHNFGAAVDLVPIINVDDEWWEAPDSLWKEYGRIAKELGFVWGGDFKSIRDYPHVESKNWKELQAKWKRGEIKIY